MLDCRPRSSALDGIPSQLERDIHRFTSGAWHCTRDQLTVEEPLQLLISHTTGGGRSTSTLSVTMRSPGQDTELAAGFLFGEGIVSSRDDVVAAAHLDEQADAAQNNVLLVTLRDGLDIDLESQRRHFATTSACGVCGKASLDQLVDDGCRPLRSACTISPAVLAGLPGVLRGNQQGFEATGGAHAAGLFGLDGELVALAEDVGRHNAVDKLIGGQLLGGNIDALAEMALVLSGRASYELLQKALRARIPIVAAVGAPSSLAVDVAETFGITLAGFVRPDRFNVYTGRSRIRD